MRDSEFEEKLRQPFHSFFNLRKPEPPVQQSQWLIDTLRRRKEDQDTAAAKGIIRRATPQPFQKPVHVPKQSRVREVKLQRECHTDVCRNLIRSDNLSGLCKTCAQDRRSALLHSSKPTCTACGKTLRLRNGTTYGLCRTDAKTKYSQKYRNKQKQAGK